MTTIFINGKFLTQSTTGAQRFATEIVLALDSFLSCSSRYRADEFVVLIPKGQVKNVPSFRHVRVVELVGFKSHLWEQVTLPWFVRDSFLINLSGSAPLLKRKQLFTMFDGAIFDFPQAYSRKFLTWYRLLFWVQARFARGLVTLSRYSRDRLCMHLNVEMDRLGIVPCGVDHIDQIIPDERILRSFDLHAGRYLLAVGSANPSKNFSTLIKAFSTLKDYHGIRLVVVGGSNSSVFAEVDVSDDFRIVRTGRINDAHLKALYSHARAFVFPSLYEGFGIPPLEAMACGCPVIASNAASIPEVCGDAVGYFEPTSILSIQNSLEKIITDNDWREKLRVAGYEKVKEYTWSVAAQKLLLHLKKVGAI